MLCGSPGSRFTSGSNRFRSCAGAAADVRVVRCCARAARAVMTTVTARYLNNQLHVTRVLFCRARTQTARRAQAEENS